MVSKILTVGDKIDITKYHSGSPANKEGVGKKVYKSQILDIESDNKIKVLMPFEGSKIVLLSLNQQYNLCFYSDGGLYQCIGKVMDRYKSNNMFIAEMELTTRLQKYQRREYYRLQCVMDFSYRFLSPEEEKMDNIGEILKQKTGSKMEHGVIVDISGGGMRFISQEEYEKNKEILAFFEVENRGIKREVRATGKIIASIRRENSGSGKKYENRVGFKLLSKEDREIIIKHIFEQERKLRKNEKS